MDLVGTLDCIAGMRSCHAVMDLVVGILDRICVRISIELEAVD